MGPGSVGKIGEDSSSPFKTYAACVFMCVQGHKSCFNNKGTGQVKKISFKNARHGTGHLFTLEKLRNAEKYEGQK